MKSNVKDSYILMSLGIIDCGVHRKVEESDGTGRKTLGKHTKVLDAY